MDAISAAASVTAIITIAAQSTKIIYGFVLGLRDGSRQAEELAAALIDLQKVLHQIELLNEAGAFSTSKYEDLGAATARCSNDLQQLEKKVARYCPDSQEKGIEKVWRQFKISLRAQDLVQIRSTVQYHFQALNVQLSIAGLSSLQKIDNSVQDSFLDFQSHVKSLSMDIHAMGLRSSLTEAEALESMKRTSTSVTELQGRIEEYFKDETVERAALRKDAMQSQAGSDQMVNAVSELSQRVESISNMSTEQYDSLKGMLTQLLSQAAPSKLDDLKSSAANTEVSSNSGILTPDTCSVSTDEENKPDEELGQVVGRLSRLASKIGKTLYSEDAQLIIDDLEEILKAATAQIVDTPLRELHGMRKRMEWPQGYVTPEEKDWQSRQDLKRVRGLLAAAQSISLIEPVSKNNLLDHKDKFKFRNRSRTFQTPLGTITVFSSSQQKNGEDESSSSTFVAENKDLIEVFVNTVTFMPSHPSSRSKLFAKFLQQVSSNGSMAAQPSLSFCSVVPEGSDVFVHVQTGQLDALKEMLQLGEASLTDCDPAGRSLLSYAHYHCQPEVCSFLIEKGADVNAREAALPVHNLSRYMRPVLMQISMHSRMHDSTAGGCRRVLLEAGADPTIEDFGEGKTRQTAFQTLFKEASNVDTMKAVLDIAGLFVDLEARFESGRTPLLAAASGGRDGIEPEIINILLQRGASPRARDLHGNSCLHIAVRYANSYWYQRRLTQALVYMIRAGADVDAENHRGVTVSEAAVGANVWEAWSEALSSCGIDAAQVRDRTFTRIQDDFDAKVGLKRRRAVRYEL